MMVLSREAERTISGASEVVAMAVTIIHERLMSSFHINPIVLYNVELCRKKNLTPVAMTYLIKSYLVHPFIHLLHPL